MNFFHQDCLSSEVRLNVDLDTVLTVLANGRYRWLASQLHGFDQSKPKGVYRKFVETSGAVEIESGHRIVVYPDRRSHNPITSIATGIVTGIIASGEAASNAAAPTAEATPLTRAEQAKLLCLWKKRTRQKVKSPCSGFC